MVRLANNTVKFDKAGEDRRSYTGRPIFHRMTVAQVLARPPLTHSPIRIFTAPQPRSLLSMDKPKSGRSRGCRFRSSQNRATQTSCGLSERFAPTMRPAFHGRLSRLAGSNTECPTLAGLGTGGSATCLPARKVRRRSRLRNGGNADWRRRMGNANWLAPAVCQGGPDGDTLRAAPLRQCAIMPRQCASHRCVGCAGAE